MSQITVQKHHKDISLRSLINPLVLQMSRMRIKAELTVRREDRPRPEGGVIYAVNHSNSLDIPLTCRAIGRQSWVLVGRQRLYLSDRLFFWLNGTIWVDRKDKADMQRAKQQILKHLQKGHAIVFYPEGTWNLTENLLMLPMKWGIIDCARQAGVSIVPMILEYSEDKRQCTAWIGGELSVKDLSLFEGITLLRDKMAEMRYLLWEERGIYSREKLNPEEERKKLFQTVTDYPPLDWEYEESVVFR